MLLVIFGITAHAELSGPSQGEKCVAIDSKQIYVGVIVKLMLLLFFFLLEGWGGGGGERVGVGGSRCSSSLSSVT